MKAFQPSGQRFGYQPVRAAASCSSWLLLGFVLTNRSPLLLLQLQAIPKLRPVLWLPPPLVSDG